MDDEPDPVCDRCPLADGPIFVVLAYPEPDGLHLTVASLDELPPLVSAYYQRCAERWTREVRS